MRYFLQSLEEQIKNATSSGLRFGVALCDLNSFKLVNDRHGHLVGNQLLTGISAGFQNLCSSGEMVARMGGDEFLFFIPVDSAGVGPCPPVTAERTSASLGVNISPLT